MKRWALCTKKNIVWDNWRIEGFYDQFLDLRQLFIDRKNNGETIQYGIIIDNDNLQIGDTVAITYGKITPKP